MAASPVSFLPSGSNDIYSGNVNVHLFDRLFDYDATGRVIPVIAESYEAQDSVTYSFTIRRGIRFHNGEEVTPGDVAFSLILAAESAGFSHYYGAIDTDSFTIDGQTVTFRLKAPNASFFPGLALVGAGIFSAAAYAASDADTWNRAPVGSGPFRFDSAGGDAVVLKRFDDYAFHKPVYTTLTFRSITDSAARARELSEGTVDIAAALSLDDAARIRDSKTVTIHRVVDNSTTYIAFNCSAPPFDDQRVREAVAYALDVPALVEEVFRGLGAPAAGPVPPGIKYADKNIRARGQNLDRARELLAESGYPGKLAFTIMVNEDPNRIKALGVAATQLKGAGIDMTVRSLPWEAYAAFLHSEPYDAMCIGWSTQVNDPDVALYGPFSSTSIGTGSNYARYESAAMDSLLEQGRITRDGPEREDIYRRIQQLIASDIPWVPLYYQTKLVGAKQGLKNLALSPYGYQSLAAVIP
jgi:peptide/nickel transport system substrate-binding protein